MARRITERRRRIALPPQIPFALCIFAFNPRHVLLGFVIPRAMHEDHRQSFLRNKRSGLNCVQSAFGFALVLRVRRCKGAAMKMNRRNWLLAARVGLAGLCIFLVGAGITVVRTWLKPEHPPAGVDSSSGPHLANGGTLLLPPETQQSLGVRVVEARQSTRVRELPPLSGSIGFDVSRLARVHSRFAGEVVAIGTTATGPF